MSELLLYGGIAIAGASVAVGLVIIIVLWTSKRKLNSKLDDEYGGKS